MEIWHTTMGAQRIHGLSALSLNLYQYGYKNCEGSDERSDSALRLVYDNRY